MMASFFGAVRRQIGGNAQRIHLYGSLIMGAVRRQIGGKSQLAC